MALDRRNYKQLVDTTVELANKVGASDIIGRVVDDLKDENEQYRKMVMETIEKVINRIRCSLWESLKAPEFGRRSLRSLKSH